MHIPRIRGGRVTLADIQNQYDDRNIEIGAVGITGLRYPITFTDGQLCHHGMADVEITVRLPASRRGTHMSRMVELTHQELMSFDPCGMPMVLKTAADRLETDSVTISVAMPFATEVTAPTSGVTAWQVHDLTIRGELQNTYMLLQSTVRTEVTILCPCSKAVSDYSAHNQRCVATLTISGTSDNPYPLPVTEAVTIIRNLGSSQVYPLLKRPDERTVTMAAYDQPAFVEDIARDLSLACRVRGLSHNVSIRSLESIHSHDAVAYVSGS